jgi:hypothetical protein
MEFHLFPFYGRNSDTDQKTLKSDFFFFPDRDNHPSKSNLLQKGNYENVIKILMGTYLIFVET